MLEGVKACMASPPAYIAEEDSRRRDSHGRLRPSRATVIAVESVRTAEVRGEEVVTPVSSNMPASPQSPPARHRMMMIVRLRVKYRPFALLRHFGPPSTIETGLGVVEEPLTTKTMASLLRNPNVNQ